MGSSLARNYCFYQPIKDKDGERVQTHADQIPNQPNDTQSGRQSVFSWHQTQSGDGGDSARTGLFYLVNKEANSKTHINQPQDLWELKGLYFWHRLFLSNGCWECSPLLWHISSTLTNSSVFFFPIFVHCRMWVTFIPPSSCVSAQPGWEH